MTTVSIAQPVKCRKHLPRVSAMRICIKVPAKFYKQLNATHIASGWVLPYAFSFFFSISDTLHGSRFLSDCRTLKSKAPGTSRTLGGCTHIDSARRSEGVGTFLSLFELFVFFSNILHFSGSTAQCRLLGSKAPGTSTTLGGCTHIDSARRSEGVGTFLSLFELFVFFRIFCIFGLDGPVPSARI